MTVTPADLKSEALAEVAAAKKYGDLSAKMLSLAVVKARGAGATWAQVAEILGISYQGARSRWLPVVESHRKALENGHGPVSVSNGAVLRASDHTGGLDGNSVAGRGDDGDQVP